MAAHIQRQHAEAFAERCEQSAVDVGVEAGRMNENDVGIGLGRAEGQSGDAAAGNVERNAFDPFADGRGGLNRLTHTA